MTTSLIFESNIIQYTHVRETCTSVRTGLVGKIMIISCSSHIDPGDRKKKRKNGKIFFFKEMSYNDTMNMKIVKILFKMTL